MILKEQVAQLEAKVKLGLSLESGICGVWGLYQGNRLICLGTGLDIELRLTKIKECLGGIETSSKRLPVKKELKTNLDKMIRLFNEAKAKGAEVGEALALAYDGKVTLYRGSNRDVQGNYIQVIRRLVRLIAYYEEKIKDGCAL